MVGEYGVDNDSDTQNIERDDGADTVSASHDFGLFDRRRNGKIHRWPIDREFSVHLIKAIPGVFPVLVVSWQ
jgi:hypothetical protein